MGSLTVLSNPGRSDAEYLHLFDRALLHWLKHLGDEADVEVGVAFASRALSHIVDANTCLDFALPEGIGAEAALAQLEAYYQRSGAHCARLVCHPDIRDVAPATSAAIASRGYQPGELTAYVLEQSRAAAAMEAEGFTIIPARASYRHAVAIAQEAAGDDFATEVEETTWLHLDDPRYDSLLAIDAAGNAAASVGVLGIGDVGLLSGLHVSAAYQDGPLPHVMMVRALEIAARSLYRHVLAGAEDSQAPLARLLSSSGFRPVGSLRLFNRKH